MTSRDFCFWLQGMFEISAAGTPNAKVFFDEAQTKCVKAHLDLVFLHEIDPSMGPPEHQEKLNETHTSKVGTGLNGLVMRC